MREILPSNPTEAGPESRNEPPMTWRDNLEFADCALLEARRLTADDAKEECLRQLRRIDTALDLIDKAQTELRARLVQLARQEAAHAR